LIKRFLLLLNPAPLGTNAQQKLPYRFILEACLLVPLNVKLDTCALFHLVPSTGQAAGIVVVALPAADLLGLTA
jgi:hypothetical protein